MAPYRRSLTVMSDALIAARVAKFTLFPALTASKLRAVAKCDFSVPGGPWISSVSLA